MSYFFIILSIILVKLKIFDSLQFFVEWLVLRSDRFYNSLSTGNLEWAEYYDPMSEDKWALMIRSAKVVAIPWSQRGVLVLQRGKSIIDALLFVVSVHCLCSLHRALAPCIWIGTERLDPWGGIDELHRISTAAFIDYSCLGFHDTVGGGGISGIWWG